VNVTIEQLRRMILNEVDSDSDGVPDSEELVDAWTFAPTAEEEAKKINAQTGVHLVTDPEHWAEYGIHTGEELARSLLASTYSDTYKGIHGIRPRWVRTSEMSVQEIQELISDLHRRSEERSESEEWMEDRFHDDQEGWESDIEDERRDAQRAYDDSREAEIAAAAAEEEAMKIPEEGEDLPSFQGMGRRLDSGFKRGRHPPGRSSWMRDKLSESLSGLDKQYYGQAVQDIVQTFHDNMIHLFDDEPSMFQGRSSRSEWEQRVSAASAELQERLENSVVDITRKIEDQIHDGQFASRDLSREGPSQEIWENNIRNGNKRRVTKSQLRRMIREALLSEERLDEGECPEDGCIQKRGKGWVVISNKTGECWGRSKKDDGECTYHDTREEAEDALKAYHVR